MSALAPRDPPPSSLSSLRRRVVPPAHHRREVAFVLNEDPDLAQGLPPSVRRTAARLSCAPVLTVNAGDWRPPQCDPETTFGLLVLDGLIGRRLALGPAIATELLTSGDILRPWAPPALGEQLALAELDWRVFHPGRLAILDGPVTQLIGRRPELALAFSERLHRRVHSLSYLLATSHLTRVEDRLLAALWHLASRRGRVTPDGVLIPFRLGHETLGEIIGSQRPTVTLGLGHLCEQHLLARRAGGHYLLTGDPGQWSLPTPAQPAAQTA